MKVIRARDTSQPTDKRTATFVGDVWGDPVMPTTDNVTINHVFFAPGGRTNWHSHERGQVLHVTGGGGWVCKDGEAPQAIRTGDVVWIAPGERHWHGAAAQSFMSHLAISLGKSSWESAVAPAEYPAA